MKKLGLLIASMMVVSFSTEAAFSQAQAPAKENALKRSCKAVGNGIMWGPRKVGAGFKKLFHKK